MNEYLIYENEIEEDIVCPLCEGSHGNNSQCQRNDYHG
jgi:hypothetical protein